MCGFSFYADQLNHDEALDISLEAISHRGPDGTGSVSFVTEFGFFGAAHARLSIQDVSPAGSQPMMSANERFILVFNGEIYNKDYLTAYIEPTVVLRGKSDTEILLESFASKGAEIFPHVRGIFAAVFFDRKTGTVTAVRDQMGVKPLYYSQKYNGLFFSSEIRGLKPFIDTLELDKKSLYEFLRAGFVHEPNTGFSNVLKVPAGYFLVYEKGTLQLVRYFDKDGSVSPLTLERVVREQLLSDVPIANLYSGGIDSSAIGLLSGVPGIFGRSRSDDLKVSGNVDDTPYALAVSRALEIDVLSVELASLDGGCSTSEFLRQVENLAVGTEELLADSTFITAKRLCQEARLKGYKVLLSGTGGDEVFIGYPRYRLLANKNLYRPIHILIKVFRLRRLLLKLKPISKKLDRFMDYFEAKNFIDAYLYLVGPFKSEEISSLWVGGDRHVWDDRLQADLESRADIDRSSNCLFNAMKMDYIGFLSHNLTVLDKASMAVGVEVRVPLLDHRLYKIMHQKVKKVGRYYGKKDLLDVLKKSVPLNLLRRRKSGFAPPLDRAIASLDMDFVYSYFHRAGVFELFNAGAVQNILSSHNESENNTYKIFNIIYLAAWLKIHRLGSSNED